MPGLRRDEVASEAGVSLDYYVRLEQGRERHPSPQVLDALARALRLGPDAAAHLHRLARPQDWTSGGPSVGSSAVPPALLTLLDGIRTPAVVASAAMDVLAANALARAFYGPFSTFDNLARMVFADPVAREFFVDWPTIAHGTVATLRDAAGRHQDDPALVRIIGELTVRSSEFARLWSRAEVHPRSSEVKRYRHPAVGDLELHYASFSVNVAAGQQLFTYVAEPGSASAEAVEALGRVAEGAG